MLAVSSGRGKKKKTDIQRRAESGQLTAEVHADLTANSAQFDSTYGGIMTLLDTTSSTSSHLVKRAGGHARFPESKRPNARASQPAAIKALNPA